MAFLKQQDYKNIMQAKKDGNPHAIALVQAYVKGCSQYDLDNMLHAFYNPEPVNLACEQEQDPKNEPAVKAVEKQTEEIEQPIPEEPAIEEPSVIDISDKLDADLDGLIDEDEIDDVSFEDFLEEKKKNANRLSKGADYFKMYDPVGRMDYLVRKSKEYDNSFNTKRMDIDRAFRDMDGAISAYSKAVAMLPDDEIEMDSSATDKAYGDLVNAGKSHSFGRSWDAEDMEEMNSILSALVATYGKDNVSAALNVIRGDNEAFRNRRNGKIDNAVRHYSKQLEDLLK